MARDHWEAPSSSGSGMEGHQHMQTRLLEHLNPDLDKPGAGIADGAEGRLGEVDDAPAGGNCPCR